MKKILSLFKLFINEGKKFFLNAYILPVFDQ